MVKVHAAKIIGTDTTVYSAWVPDTFYQSQHHTTTSFDGVVYGKMGTERLPEDLDAIPAGEERIRTVRAWRAAVKLGAIVNILAAHPDLLKRGGVADGHEIRLESSEKG